jgi:preprotein translocase subunit SecD
VAAVATSKPMRGLFTLLGILVLLAVWAFWPGGDNTVRLGLDLQGGTQVVLVAKPVTPGTEITEEQLNQTVEIIRQRVDGLGVAEAEVTTQGTGAATAIVVSVPGENQERVVELVQRTALLNFRPVWAIDGPAPTPADSTETTHPQAADNSPEFQTQVQALNCLDPIAFSGGTPDNPEEWLGTCDQTGISKYLLEPAFIRGTNVTGAEAALPQSGFGWVVTLNFDSEGARALADASSRLTTLPECGTPGGNPCNAFAIVLDGVVVSAPRFNEAILGGQAQIEGDFTAQEAADLANVLKYGALPVTLEAVDVTTISATVGTDQLRAGILAGLLGLVLVVLFLLIYYRALGSVAVLSLVLGAGILYMSFVIFSKTIGLTLTLAGVAGAIVAIGITADSFIVYFERIKDEIRDGRSLRQACDSGWVRARRTILASDFVSILAAVVLYYVSVGSVRGFAFVLGLTTIIDLLIAFLFTRPVTVLLGRTRWMQRGSKWTGLDKARIGEASLAGAIVEKSRRRPRQEVQT